MNWSGGINEDQEGYLLQNYCGLMFGMDSNEPVIGATLKGISLFVTEWSSNRFAYPWYISDCMKQLDVFSDSGGSHILHAGDNNADRLAE